MNLWNRYTAWLAIVVGLVVLAFAGTISDSDATPPDVQDTPTVTITDNRWHCLPPTVTVNDYNPAFVTVEQENGTPVQPGVPFAVYNGRVDLVMSGWFYMAEMHFWGWEDTGWDSPLAGTATSGRYNAPAPYVPCQNSPRLVKNGVRK